MAPYLLHVFLAGIELWVTKESAVRGSEIVD
jgi:hypothetical protein